MENSIAEAMVGPRATFGFRKLEHSTAIKLPQEEPDLITGR